MAGRIPQNFIDDLLNRADIVDIVDARVKLRKTGKNYSGLCPFHQEKTPSFTVQPDKQFYYCFGCGAGGNALGFLMNYENIEFVQAVENLAGQVGVEVPYEDSTPRQKEQRRKQQTHYDILDQASRFYQSQLRQHPQKQRAVDYLKSRGLSGEIARHFSLGYAPPGWDNLLKHSLSQNRTNEKADQEKGKKLLLESGMLIERDDKSGHYDRFRDRIIYPIRDRRGRVIGFGGRVLGDAKPKYLNSPETPVFHKGEELYGLYEARRQNRQLERILIVEGYMDVIALAQHDIWYAVATLGTATSASHLEQLFKLVAEVVFCFDGDTAGRQAAWRALEQVLPLMTDGRSARFLFLPEGEDPDSQVRRIGKQGFEQNINEASPLSTFFFDALAEDSPLDSPEHRARLNKEALPHIQKLPEGVFRKLMLDKLRQFTGMPDQASSDIPPARPDMPLRGSSKKPARQDRAISLCMKAVNLILRQPDIANRVELQGLEAVHSPDIELLQEVIQLSRRHPQSTTPQLLGRLYATPLGNQLSQLSKSEQITPNDGVEREFRDTIGHLLSRHQRHTRQQAMLQQARDKLTARRNNPGQAEQVETEHAAVGSSKGRP